VIKSKIQSSIVIGALLFSGVLFAVNPEPVKTEDPVQLLKNVTTDVLQALKANKISPKVKSKKIFDVVDKYILPYVDFNEMSTWVAGRTAWGKASEKNKEEFISAFKILVVRTYATALNSYSNEVLQFGKQKVDTSKNRIQISSKIVRANKENISLDYRLIKHENTWLVYDIIIEGVSILQGFQAQFSEEIKHKGLDTVIAKIKEHNRQGEV